MFASIIMFLFSSAQAGDLPDVTKSLAKGICDNGPGAEGADSYFAGEFTIKGNQVVGTEKWILFANPKWKAKGGKDCVLEWRITGTVSDGGKCNSCSTGIQFHAVADVDGSNCPEELVKGRLLPDGRRVGGEGQDFDNKYGISISGGAAKVHFAKSGKLIGEGYNKGNTYNWVSSHQCKWF